MGVNRFLSNFEFDAALRDERRERAAPKPRRTPQEREEWIRKEAAKARASRLRGRY